MEARAEGGAAAGSPPSLFELSGVVVSSAMGTLEREVWALPGQILQGILPLLNIYYLERIEETAVKKGLSTQPIWHKLWNDVMKIRPPKSENITSWRKKFLETFFSNVLHGVLDVSSDQRLSDHRFSPLLHSSRHVTQLTICNMLQGVAELTAEPNQRVLENLAGSLRTLKFHLLTSDLSIRHSLSLLLHHLIHHGAVSQVSMCSWPVPDKVLLVLILSMSAGFWHPGKTLMHQGSPCSLCREESDAQSLLTQEDGALLGSNQLCCGSTEQSETGQWGDSESRSKKVQTASAKVLQEADADSQASIELSRSSSGTVKTPMLCGLRSHPLQNLACQDVSCTVPPEYYNIKGESSPSLPKRSSVGPAFRKPCRRLKTAVGRKRRSPRRNRRAHAEPEDLYDFVFAVAREEEETTESLYESNAQEGESVDGWASSPADTPSFEGVGCTEGGSVGILPLKAACRFRSVSTLELFSIPLTGDTCRALGNLLSSWVSLEKLVLSYNGLGANIFRILSGLRALSHRRDCSLHVVRVSDVFAHIPSVELVRSILTAFPRLHTLSVSFDLKNQLEGNRPERHSSSEAEIPESCLEQLEIRFPREPLQTSLLLPVLKASRSLQQLSLDSATISCPLEFGLLLQALKECNPGLKRLSFHDVNLADYQKEVLLLLQDPVLQEITFSFCRLFESCTTEFLSDIIQIVKRNSTLKSLKLPGNRLGNHRLVALADIFSEDSSSSICQLDVSSNCIKPDGLLEFAKKLESHILQRGGQIKFTHLRLFQNWLDQDAATAQEALRRLRAVCNVVSNTWDSSQAFADYISVM
ncbi:leucine-rich repeat-containing protein 41 [Malaclemys terrapin pileata]|uniref:leucine-rich repeat-containing protein 41 n=1 Tax=Malaclemys terrapin pileata TaxID=2991368 RepID=UPI0023A84753|nr:leucine-rich repeat-containing protein 41 [Malaclemys terrapin pileata]